MLAAFYAHATIVAAGEALIVCVVISCPDPRPLSIRPKKSANGTLVSGDEQIEIVSCFGLHIWLLLLFSSASTLQYPCEGDAYDMDGMMQLGYEHSLPKKTKTSSHRFAIVFRNGEQGYVR